MGEDPYPDHQNDSDSDVVLAYVTDGSVTHCDRSSATIPGAPSPVSLTCLTSPSQQEEPFAGFFIHSGAAGTVFEKDMWATYWYTRKEWPQARLAEQKFKFCQHVYRSLQGSLARIIVPSGHSLSFTVSVINRKVPFLLGLDVLSSYAINLEFGSGYMRGSDRQWHVNFHSIGELALIIPSNPER